MMPCTSVQRPGGGFAIVCTTTRRCGCGRRGVFLCDWKVPNRATGTCDRPICASCAACPAPDKHLCIPHTRAWKAHPSMKPKPPTGVITGSFDRRDGEKVWIIAWDDRQTRPMQDVDTSGNFRDGQRVQLVGRQLQGVGL